MTHIQATPVLCPVLPVGHSEVQLVTAGQGPDQQVVQGQGAQGLQARGGHRGHQLALSLPHGVRLEETQAQEAWRLVCLRTLPVDVYQEVLVEDARKLIIQKLSHQFQVTKLDLKNQE